MGSMSIGHWLIVLIVVVLLFGAKKIPELAKGLGRLSKKRWKRTTNRKRSRKRWNKRLKTPKSAILKRRKGFEKFSLKRNF